MKVRIPYQFQALARHGAGDRTNLYQGAVEAHVPDVDLGETDLVLRFDGFKGRRGDVAATERPSVEFRVWAGRVWETLLGPGPEGTSVPVTVRSPDMDLSLHCTDVPRVNGWHSNVANGFRMFDASRAPHCYEREQGARDAERALASFAFFDGVAHRATDEPVLCIGPLGFLVHPHAYDIHNFRPDEADLALEVLSVRGPGHVDAARARLERLDVVAPHLLRGRYHDEDLVRAGTHHLVDLAQGLRDRPRAVVLAHADLRDAMTSKDVASVRQGLEAVMAALPGTEAATVIGLHLDVHARRSARLDADECPSLATVSL